MTLELEEELSEHAGPELGEALELVQAPETFPLPDYRNSISTEPTQAFRRLSSLFS
jgi:hypothetical protein